LQARRAGPATTRSDPAGVGYNCGGAPQLGVNGIVIIGHGRSDGARWPTR
jgi:fatty acid/phospholipid biosynthesis enzyme